jgi:regulator of protease activity HflC (stomatin/prohibitin superfamily)
MRPFLPLFVLFVGCNSMDIPQAHRGRMFDKTGLLAGFTGGDGFQGPVLGPGTYWVGIYDRVRVIDCSLNTQKEDLTSLTKDGVQFGLDVYVRYAPNCTDDSVVRLLDTLVAAEGGVVSAQQIYSNFVRPALGEAVREIVSPIVANDLNNKREEVLAGIRTRFIELLAEQPLKAVNVEQVNLSNMDFPEEMDDANTERAVQAVLRDKAIAERERVEAEIETATRRRELADREGAVEAARIDQIGAALGRNPGYLQYQLQIAMPGIYEKAGATGNMVITAPEPNVFVTPRRP